MYTSDFIQIERSLKLLTIRILANAQCGRNDSHMDIGFQSLTPSPAEKAPTKTISAAETR